MVKRIFIAAALLAIATYANAAVELDGDANGATDISKGGTNATSAANARTNLGLGGTDNVTFGNVSASGNTLSVGAGGTTQGTLVLRTNTDPIYTFGISPAALPSEIVSLKAPAAMPTADNSIFQCDINGTCDWTDPATFATPTGSAASMTVVASGFDGNLTTTDNTLQEIAQKVDDLNIAGGGYTNLTEFIAQTAWRVFYSDGSGDVKELALGADGTYLKSNGASSIPSFDTPAGSGDMVLASVQSVTGLKTFDTTKLAVKGSSTGTTAIASANAGASNYTLTLPAVTGTVALTSDFAAPGAIGGTTPAAATFTTIGAGASGFSVDADGDVTAKSVTITRTTSPTAVRFYEGTGGGDNYIDLTLSGNLAGDSTVNLDALITTSSFDDTPDNGSTTTAPTANWAFDHEADTTTHGVSSGAILGGALGTTDNQLLRSDGTGGSTAQGTGITVDDSNNVTAPGNISSNGSITGLMPSKVISSPSGTHDGSSDAATLSDSGESFTTNAYVGMILYNITDGSSCTVTANDGTTMTCTLAGGTDNDWDASDAWQVGPGAYQSGSWFYVTGAGTIRHPSTAGYQVCYESDAAAVLTVDMASSSMIFQGVLDSTVTALDAGDSIDSSGSTTGDFQCIHNKSATEAQGKGKRGTWVDGGAS